MSFASATGVVASEKHPHEDVDTINPYIVGNRNARTSFVPSDIRNDADLTRPCAQHGILPFSFSRPLAAADCLAVCTWKGVGYKYNRVRTKTNSIYVARTSIWYPRGERDVRNACDETRADLRYNRLFSDVHAFESGCKPTMVRLWPRYKCIVGVGPRCNTSESADGA
jgi:hypothetical protein